MQTIIYILPELFISSAIMLFLMLGVFIKNSYKLISFLTILILAFAAILTMNHSIEITKVFKGGLRANSDNGGNDTRFNRRLGGGFRPVIGFKILPRLE